MEVASLLQFERVMKKYADGTPAVSNLNLNIEEGEFVCFIGPSGCGKTTTMKMVNRLIDITEGTIYINGKDIKSQNAVELRRSIGYVIQQVGLMPHMTIKENISLVGTLLKWPSDRKEKRAKELLALVDMPEEYLDKYPHELSGGQQQRIGVLRALAANPPLILMDEPFGALDPITRDSLQEEFKKLQKELNKTIVFVTHDMDEALKLGDRIVIMKDGEVVQADTPEEILRNPANEFVETFLGKDRLIQARPDVTTVGQIMDTDPITVTCGTSLKDAIATMRERHVDTLLVVDRDGTLRGFLDVEAINLNYKKAAYVEDVMETDLFSVSEDSLLKDTTHKILRRGAKYIPVTDGNHHLTGIVTRATMANIVYDTIWGEGQELDSLTATT
ncbi:osmoprotectant transport system ATP-binding protein [Salimicrobium album]|uniref:Quaternary amine transport ATP-binding protein n=2 Tax=Salimicrobium TaxID=351195 RepID=A0ABY1KTF4_9BACI|nr:osmoprotectant transport system ATP-binding protein [Salimicrobium album]SIS75063.1 osmoprotectant transport system ATP-binding protein [Salimicrobium salexigens]